MPIFLVALFWPYGLFLSLTPCPMACLFLVMSLSRHIVSSRLASLSFIVLSRLVLRLAVLLLRCCFSCLATTLFCSVPFPLSHSRLSSVLPCLILHDLKNRLSCLGVLCHCSNRCMFVIGFLSPIAVSVSCLAFTQTSTTLTPVLSCLWFLQRQVGKVGQTPTLVCLSRLED